MRIDTRPPAKFNPDVSYLTTKDKIADKTLVSFFTTDNLSGIDRYEVGVIDKVDESNASPIFVEVESPYQVPMSGSGYLNVIVRAIDGAGNVSDVSLDIEPQTFVSSFFKSNWLLLVLILLAVLITGFVTNYFVGHHVLRHIRSAMNYIRKDTGADQPINPVSIDNEPPQNNG